MEEFFLDVDDELQILRQFQHYLWYRNDDRRHRHGWCSCCTHLIEADNTDREGFAQEFFKKKHNDSITCPYCGQALIMKAEGRMTTASTLNQTQRVVIVKPQGHDRVFLVGVLAYACFNMQDAAPELKVAVIRKYDLSPGNAVMYKPSGWQHWRPFYDWTFDGLQMCAGSIPWCAAKSVREPFKGGMYNRRDYVLLGMDRLKGTFLEYSCFDEFMKLEGRFDECNWVDRGAEPVRYLGLFAEHPQFEFLMKFGFEDFVRDYVYYDRNNGRDVNWKAKDPAGFFRLSKQEFRIFAEFGGGRHLLRAWHQFSREFPGASMQDFSALQKKYGIDRALILLRAIATCGLGLEAAQNRLSRYKVDFPSWCDYINAAKKLDYDLKDPVVAFPKKFQEAHDNAMRNLISSQNKKVKAKYKLRYDALTERFAYAKNGFFIMVPPDQESIVAEGKALHHCVGGYAARHVEGKVTILFMRSFQAPDIPLFTLQVEMTDRGFHVVQIQGDRNVIKPKGAKKQFYEEWCEWVRKGSPREEIKEEKVG